MDLSIVKEFYLAHQIAVQLGVAMAFLVAAVKWGRQFLRALQKRASQLAWLFSEQHEHETILASLAVIQGELTRNGGSSLKDSIDRIEKNVDKVKDRQTAINAYIRTSFNTNSKPIFECDPRGHLIYMNKAFLEMAQFRESDLLDMGWVNLISPSCRDRVQELWFEAVNDQRNFDEIIEYQKPDGERYAVHVQAYIIRSGSSRNLGYIGEVTVIEE